MQWIGLCPRGDECSWNLIAKNNIRGHVGCKIEMVEDFPVATLHDPVGGRCTCNWGGPLAFKIHKSAGPIWIFHICMKRLLLKLTKLRLLLLTFGSLIFYSVVAYTCRPTPIRQSILVNNHPITWKSLGLGQNVQMDKPIYNQWDGWPVTTLKRHCHQ